MKDLQAAVNTEESKNFILDTLCKQVDEYLA